MMFNLLIFQIFRIFSLNKKVKKKWMDIHIRNDDGFTGRSLRVIVWK